MTDDRTLRRMTALMDELAAGDDSYVDDILARTGKMNQRPAWTFATRWLPASVAPRARPRQSSPILLWIVLAALLVATIVGAALVGASLMRDEPDVVRVVVTDVTPSPTSPSPTGSPSPTPSAPAGFRLVSTDDFHIAIPEDWEYEFIDAEDLFSATSPQGSSHISVDFSPDTLGNQTLVEYFEEGHDALEEAFLANLVSTESSLGGTPAVRLAGIRESMDAEPMPFEPAHYILMNAEEPTGSGDLWGLVLRNPGDEPDPAFETVIESFGFGPAEYSVAPTATPGEPVPWASTLPALRLPGSRAAAAGEYGWTGPMRSRAGLHSRATQLVFAVQNDCFPRATGAQPTSVTIAGLDGLYLEPYEDPDALFVGTSVGTTTGAYALTIGGRTLCVYATWDSAATADDLSALRQVVESIRGEPLGLDGIRVNFTLPAGWDTG